jgi:hypothetical protein
LLPTYLDYRRLLRDAQELSPPGLLHSAFLVESPRSCINMSVWSTEPFFSAAVPSHVDAANRVFGRLQFDADRGPELWSTGWRLETVSNNLNWRGFDLRRHLLGRTT